MRTILTCLYSLIGFFFIYGQTDDIKNIQRHGDSLIHSFEFYYSTLNSDNRALFESEMQNTYFFDKKRSIQNIINNFGPNFYKEKHCNFRKEVTNRLSGKVEKSDTLNLFNRVKRLREVLSNKSADLYDYTWDGFSTYYNLTHNKKRYSFSNSNLKIYNNIWNYEYSSNNQGLLFLQNIDQIYKMIEDINRPKLKYDAYSLFLKNLYIDQNWIELFNGSNKLLNNILKEPLNNIQFNSILNYQDGYEINSNPIPFQRIEIYSKKQKVECLVKVLKLLISAEVFDNNSNYSIANYFGVLYQLTDNEKFLSTEREVILDMEIEFLNTIGRLELVEKKYYQRSFDLINNRKHDFSSISSAQFLKYNIYLTDMSLNLWNWNKVNLKEYTELQKKQTAQCLFIGLNEVKNIKTTNAQSIRYIKGINNTAGNFFSYINDNQSAMLYYIKALKMMEEYPRYFSENELIEISLNISKTLIVFKQYNHAYLLFDAAGGDSFFLKLKNGIGDPSLLDGNEIIEQYSPMLDSYIEEKDTFFNDMPNSISQLLPTMEYILIYLESAYLEKEDLQNAYQTSKFIRELQLHKRNNSFLNYQMNMNSWYSFAKSEELNITSNQQKKESDIYIRTTLELKKHIKSQQQKLKKYDVQLERKNLEIVQLDSYIQSKKEELRLSNNDTSFWKDNSSNATKSKNWFFTLLIIASLFLSVSITAFFYAQKQRKKAENQSLISESLRLAIAQVGHIGKNSIGKFKKTYIENTSDKAYIALKNIENLLQRFESSNKSSQRVRTVGQEVSMGLLLAKVDFEEELPSLDLERKVTYLNKDVKKLKVPIYSVMNLVYNSFKHSVKKNGVNIQINSINKLSHTEFHLTDQAEKFSYSVEDSGKHGTLYIQRMLSSFNKKKNKLNYQTKKTETGFSVSFNLDKI